MRLTERLERLESADKTGNISVTVSLADHDELAALTDEEWRERYGTQSRSSMVLVRIEE